MKILKVLCLMLAVLSLDACQYGYRKPSSISGPLYLHKEVENILSDVRNSGKFKLETCAPYIQNVYQDVLKLAPTRFDYDSTKQNWQSTYDNLWQIRLKLRERLVEFSQDLPADHPQLNVCVIAMRDGFRLSRYMEDFLAESFSGVPQDFKAANPKNQFDPKFKPTPLRGESPWLVLNQTKFPKMTVRSGDIIISRGNAYTSSAIARIAEVDSQFSHMAFVFVQGDGTGQEYSIEQAILNPNVKVLESHIEVGSTIRTFKEYMDDGNARNLAFRYPDPFISHRSARWVYDYIQNYRKRSFDANPLDAMDDVNHNVPYNFQMGLENPENPKKLFCSQVAHVGFHSNNVRIPYFMSALNPRLSLPKRLGVTTKLMFAPGDLEVDPRFEMIGEYRNLRKLKGLRMKDMVLSGMYKMMEQGYELTPVPQTELKSVFGWVIRQLDVKFTKPQMPKNMNVKVLSTVFTLDKVAMYLETELQKEETNFEKVSQGLPMSFVHGLETLERVRLLDREIYMSKRKPKFHWEFRPPNLRPGGQSQAGG